MAPGKGTAQQSTHAHPHLAQRVDDLLLCHLAARLKLLLNLCRQAGRRVVCSGRGRAVGAGTKLQAHHGQMGESHAPASRLEPNKPANTNNTQQPHLKVRLDQPGAQRGGVAGLAALVRAAHLLKRLQQGRQPRALACRHLLRQLEGRAVVGQGFDPRGDRQRVAVELPPAAFTQGCSHPTCSKLPRQTRTSRHNCPPPDSAP